MAGGTKCVLWEDRHCDYHHQILGYVLLFHYYGLFYTWQQLFITSLWVVDVGELQVSLPLLLKTWSILFPALVEILLARRGTSWLYHKSCRDITAFRVTSCSADAPIQLSVHDWIVTFILTRWSRGSLMPAHPISSPGFLAAFKPLTAKVRSHTSCYSYANLPPAAALDKCSCQACNVITAQTDVDGRRKWLWWEW